MTIKLENKVNTNGVKPLSTQEFVKQYSKELEKHSTFSKDVAEFSELMAKHPADVFIITSFKEGEKCEQIRQGDIYLFRKGNKAEGTLDNVMYAKYIKTMRDKKETKSMNLQLGESITGDHKIIPLKGTKVKVYDCNILLPIKSMWGSSAGTNYPVKLVVANGPFGVFHKEHGNITCPKGTYLACTQLDARSMTRMLD